MTIKTRASSKPAAKTVGRKPDAKQVANSKAAAVDAELPLARAATNPQQVVELPGLDQNVTGRGVFAVRTLGAAVSVESAFLAEDGNVLRLPAIFPNREYAQAQLEELWQLINRHFDDIEKAAKGAK